MLLSLVWGILGIGWIGAGIYRWYQTGPADFACLAIGIGALHIAVASLFLAVADLYLQIGG